MTDDTAGAFLATVNVPGYLPMDDEPPTFDTAREAWDYLTDDRMRGEEDGDDGEDYSPTANTLAVLATAAHWQGNDVPEWLQSHGLDATGCGTIYGPTPGGSIHDLGLAYSVSRVEPAPAVSVMTYADGFGRWHARVTASDSTSRADMLDAARDAIADEIRQRMAPTPMRPVRAGLVEPVTVGSGEAVGHYAEVDDVEA